MGYLGRRTCRTRSRKKENSMWRRLESRRGVGWSGGVLGDRGELDGGGGGLGWIFMLLIRGMSSLQFVSNERFAEGGYRPINPSKAEANFAQSTRTQRFKK